MPINASIVGYINGSHYSTDFFGCIVLCGKKRKAKKFVELKKRVWYDNPKYYLHIMSKKR